MFCTHADGEMPIPPIFDDGSECWWSYVKLPLFVPYFQLVCGSRCESRGSLQTFFIQTIDKVLSILRDPVIDVISVQLVSPGHMNRSGNWQIDELRTIYRGVESQSADFKQYAFLYVVANGSRYLDSCVANTESDLSGLEVICEIPAATDPLKAAVSESD